jgi:hypothetical protein
MSNYTKSGFNLSSLNEIEPLQLNISVDWASIQNSMIAESTQALGPWFPIITYSALFVMIYWSLTEVSPFAAFRYTYLRALPLALGIVNLLSISMISIGYISSFRVVAVFFMLNILSSIFVLALENQQ